MSGSAAGVVLYDRKVQLTVSPKASDKGLDLSLFRIHFLITQKTIETPNLATIRVYNLADTTVATLKGKGEYTRVRLSAGYAGQYGLLFDGSIVFIRSGREDPLTTFIDLIAADGDIPYNQAVVSTSIAAGSSATTHLKAAVAPMLALGATMGPMPELTTAVSPRGRTLFGMARDYIRDIAQRNGLTWSIQNGVLTFIPNNQALPDSAVELTSATGMIGLPTQTQLGITVRMLLNPQMKIGRRVHINNKSIQSSNIDTSYAGAVNNAFLPRIAEDGFYRALVINHVGDTRGQEWYTDCVCIALGDPITKGLVSQGQGG